MNDMKIYAYIRVSTEMQTFANQEYEIRNWCERHGLEVYQWVSESVSGTVKFDKRKLGRLIRKMVKGDMLVCTELSRLGRNMMMIMGILNECSSKGLAIHTIKDNFELTDRIDSKIIAFAFALAAEIERNLISQRTKEALAVRRMQGIRLGRPPGISKKGLSVYKRMDEAIRLRKMGMSLGCIAKELGIHRNTLRKYLLYYNINKIP